MAQCDAGGVAHRYPSFFSAVYLLIPYEEGYHRTSTIIEDHDATAALDDLLETSASVYHRRVAVIQLEVHRCIGLLIAKYQGMFDAYRQKHPHCNVQQIHSVYDLQCMKEIADVRKRGRMQIAYEARVREERDASIARFVSDSIPHTSDGYVSSVH